MPVDFRDAAERHYEDAGYLLADDRLSDADHLFGLSGECALKAVMLYVGYGAPTRWRARRWSSPGACQ